MLDKQNQGPQCTACGSPMKLSVIEPSMWGQDPRTFACPHRKRIQQHIIESAVTEAWVAPKKLGRLSWRPLKSLAADRRPRLNACNTHTEFEIDQNYTRTRSRYAAFWGGICATLSGGSLSQTKDAWVSHANR